MDSVKCNHIVGISKEELIKQSELEFPNINFIYCPVCGTKINWDYLSRKILFK